MKHKAALALFLLGGLLTGFLMLEIWIRLTSTDYISQGIYERSATRSYALKPNNTFTSQRGVPNQTNSEGLPEREVPLNKPKGQYRILVLGDSSTHNVDVPSERRLTAILERKLNKLLGKDKTVVINAGVTGYNLDQFFTLYDEVGTKYSPDYVILRYHPQDSFGASWTNRLFLAAPSFIQDLVIFIYDHSVLIRKIRQIVLRLTSGNNPITFPPPDKFLASPQWAETKKRIVVFRDRLKRDGVGFALGIVSYLFTPERFKPYYLAIEDFAEEYKIPVATAWPIFASFPDLTIYWSADNDPHPNTAANEIVGQALYEFMITKGPFSTKHRQ